MAATSADPAPKPVKMTPTERLAALSEELADTRVALAKSEARNAELEPLATFRNDMIARGIDATIIAHSVTWDNFHKQAEATLENHMSHSTTVPPAAHAAAGAAPHVAAAPAATASATATTTPGFWGKAWRQRNTIAIVALVAVALVVGIAIWLSTGNHPQPDVATTTTDNSAVVNKLNELKSSIENGLVAVGGKVDALGTKLSNDIHDVSLKVTPSSQEPVAPSSEEPLSPLAPPSSAPAAPLVPTPIVSSVAGEVDSPVNRMIEMKEGCPAIDLSNLGAVLAQDSFEDYKVYLPQKCDGKLTALVKAPVVLASPSDEPDIPPESPDSSNCAAGMEPVHDDATNTWLCQDPGQAEEQLAGTDLF